MKQLTTLFALLLLLIVTPMVATSCTDNTDDEKQDLEFTTNWKKRNVAYFDSVLTLARQKVAERKHNMVMTGSHTASGASSLAMPKLQVALRPTLFVHASSIQAQAQNHLSTPTLSR